MSDFHIRKKWSKLACVGTLVSVCCNISLRLLKLILISRFILFNVGEVCGFLWRIHLAVLEYIPVSNTIVKFCLKRWVNRRGVHGINWLNLFLEYQGVQF